MSMRHLSAVTAAIFALCLFSTGCAVISGDDQSDLQAAYEKAPKEDRDSVAAMVIAAKTKKYLERKNPKAEVGHVRCRNTYEDGTVSPWTIEIKKQVVVADVLSCLGKGISYVRCIELMGSLAEQETLKAVIADYEKANLPDDHPIYSAVIECEWKTNPGYEPAAVPGATDDLNRVTMKEIGDWLAHLPAPPTGLSPAFWRVIGVILVTPMPSGGAWGAGPDNGGVPGATSGGDT